MQFDDYLTASAATAIYPAEHALAYPTLGLAGEATEVLTAVTSGASATDVRAELGDVCWYLAAVCREAHIAAGELEGGSFDGPAHLALVQAAGVAAEQVKKTLRSGLALPPPARREVLVTTLATALAAVDALAAAHGGSRAGVLSANLAKLSDRHDRGVLDGDGDHR